MIDTSELRAFVEKIQGGTIPVDLLKIGQSHFTHHTSNPVSKKFNNNNNQHGKFRVALDIEDCLDRFYGGYYSDWACGGQWNRAYQFVQLLVNAFTSAHIEMVVFFDGTLKDNRNLTTERNDTRQKTISVLKHIRMIGTPPPKVWWLPPIGLKTCLRNALRSLNILVIQTVYDHTMEVIDYFYENKMDGILGLNSDYIIANMSKYYSSHDLRLSYKGPLETKEYVVSKLLSSLSLTPDHLPFMAVFLGGYILIDNNMLKEIYQQIDVDFTGDFEARIRKLAEIIRNSPTNDIEEFIRQLKLNDWSKEIKDSVEYYQRKARFTNTKKYLGGKRKNVSEILRINDDTPSPPMASETNESDEIARKMLHDVSNLVDDGEPATNQSSVASTSSGDGSKIVSNKRSATFVYALPAEVLKTALNRHQRGIMDSRIYQLLTKKEIILSQVLEDESGHEIPSIHLFYRPARQYVYAILFNLFHQKYLYSKTVSTVMSKDGKKNVLPEVQVSEWIPQNECKKPEMVNAVQLPWAVPTIQRLWFGMAFEDKQRRMKAFLTVMRSDTPLMLNRSYVPQHLLVLACVLRYIVTSPERKIITRSELDAFLATAFSPHIINIDYTQKLVLPGIHLRGVYLATLFMQGVETAGLANDACGVPLPWMMTNPWLFFDGKLFHLKLKMATCVHSMRDLCENQIDIVLKIERFRKAILEDIEHLLPPNPMEPMYRSTAGFIQAQLPQVYGKNALHAMQNLATLPNGTQSAGFFNPLAQQQSQLQAHHSFNQSQSNNPNFYNTPITSRSTINYRNCYGSNQQHTQSIHQQNRQQLNRTHLNRQSGYQLKVGGVVVGSWAGGAPNRNQSAHNRLNRNNVAIGANMTNTSFVRFPVNVRNRSTLNVRLQRAAGQHVTSLSRTISRNTYGTKITRTRNRRNRKERKETKTTDANTKNTKTSEDDSESDENKNEEGANADAENANGTANQASSLAKSMCQNILNEEEDDIPVSDGEKPTTSDDAVNETNGNIVDKMSALDINNQNTELNVNGKLIEDENMNKDVSDKMPSANKKKVNKKGNTEKQNNVDDNENTEIVANEGE